jgi:hypothetical protein
MRVAGDHSDGTASASVDSGGSQNQEPVKRDVAELLCRIEAFETALGEALYRGLLKRVARVWRPSQEIKDGLDVLVFSVIVNYHTAARVKSFFHLFSVGQ